MELTLSNHAGIWHWPDASLPDPDCSHCSDAGCPECDPGRFCEHGVDLEVSSCTCRTATADEVAEFDCEVAS